ncbi:MAG: histidinol dehydrogenase, partial [Geminicoccaceae bacterium]
MPIRLHLTDPDFESRFQALIETKRQESSDVETVVREILDRVAQDGDQALFDYTERCDRHQL